MLNNLHHGNYYLAFEQGVTSFLFMKTHDVLSNSNLPFAATAFVAGIVAYNAYNFIVEFDKFIQEYNSDEQKQKSLKAYSDMYHYLSESSLQNLFDFKVLADNIDAQIIGNTESNISLES